MGSSDGKCIESSKIFFSKLKGFENIVTDGSLTDSLPDKVTISRLNRIGRQLQPVKLAADEWAVNWQTTSEYQT